MFDILIYWDAPEGQTTHSEGSGKKKKVICQCTDEQQKAKYDVSFIMATLLHV